MYTYEKIPLDQVEYLIIDPEGDTICSVYTEQEAIALISHLNR